MPVTPRAVWRAGQSAGRLLDRLSTVALGTGMDIVLIVLAVVGALTIIAVLGMALMHGMMMGTPIGSLAGLLILIAIITAVVILVSRRK